MDDRYRYEIEAAKRHLEDVQKHLAGEPQAQGHYQVVCAIGAVSAAGRALENAIKRLVLTQDPSFELTDRK